jgi:hypothetical protein
MQLAITWTNFRKDFLQKLPIPGCVRCIEKTRLNELKLAVNILEKHPSFCRLFFLLLPCPCRYNLLCGHL